MQLYSSLSHIRYSLAGVLRLTLRFGARFTAHVRVFIRIDRR